VLEFAEVTIGNGGVARCARCSPPVHGEVTFGPAAAVTQRIAATAAEWAGGPGPNVAFTGAEPFAHPELPALVGAAVAAGAERIRLRTDAGALAGGNNASGVLAAGVRHIEVVLVGGDAQVHDGIVGRPGLYDAAVAGVAAFRSAAQAADVPVAITGYVPVCRHNAAHVVSTVLALAACGAVSVELQPVDGYRIDAATALAAFQAAVVNAVSLRGHGVPAAGIAPWAWRGTPDEGR